MGDKPGVKINGLVYVAVGVAAVGGLLFGYDTGVISGALIFVKEQYGLSSLLEEIVVSAVLVGAVLGAILGGVLTTRYGRRKLIILSGMIFTAGAIGTALSPTVTWLIAGRVASGIAIGVASFISPMYIAELAPARVRAALVAVNMLAIATGIVVAYLGDYALATSHAWRTMFGLAAIPSLALVLGMWPLPESPRWLAEQSGGWRRQLSTPAFKMPLIVGVGLAIFQQITGINTVMYYSPTIFRFAGVTRIGAAFEFPQFANVKSTIAISGLIIYVSGFAIGLGPVFWLLISEIYPLKFRGAAMSAVTVINWAMNMGVAVTFLSLVDLIGHAGTFWLYGVIAIGAWVFCYRLVPETKGKTLEQIEAHWRRTESPPALQRTSSPAAPT
jgi:SP family galactose:H+ symporter-like MFS transporter